MKSSPRISLAVYILAALSMFPAASTIVQCQVNFSAPPAYTGSGTLFVADFNGDGKPDILTASGTLNMGNGDGTFTTGTPVVGQPVAVADFNGDGKLDVLEQVQGTLQVLLGNGDGTFQAPVITNIVITLTAVAAIDLNGDGKADVAGVVNNTLLVYINTGNGTFATGVSYNLGSFQGSPTLMVFGDFNGDGKTDVVVLTQGTPGQEIVLLGNGDGTFQSTPIVTNGVDGLLSVVVGDFNGDGKLDLATSALVASGNIQVATVFLQLGNGDGTFQAPTTACTSRYSGGEPESIALATADVNVDGKLDLVLTADLIGVYLGNGDGTFPAAPNYYQPMSSGGAGIAIADFNLDGKPDVAADGEILLGNRDGTLKGPPTVVLPSSADIAVAGQFVKNGAWGVAAISNATASTLYILTNDGTGLLTVANTYTLPQPSYAIAAADVNGDGNLDLVVTGADPNSHNWSYTVLLGNGNGSFQAPALYQQNTQAIATTIVIADFNNDGRLDLAVPAGNSVAVLLGNGNGTFATPTLYFDGEADSILSADFNGDGRLDLAAGGSSGLALLLGNGDGTFRPATFPYTTGFGPAFAVDLNGDGNADLVGNSAGIQVLMGNGNGTFKALTLFGNYGANGFSSAVALADVNGDGNLDVIAGGGVGSTVNNGIYLGNGDGTFDTSEISVPYNYPPRSAVLPGVQAADMNGDGKPDLVIESPVSTVFVLLNSTATVPGTRFSPPSVNFLSQAVGTSSRPTPVKLTNPGTVALTVQSVTLAGSNAGQFKQTNNCTTIQPLANCMINVTFAPTVPGGLTANLLVTDNAYNGSQQVVLSGTAVVPGFAISAAAPSPTSVSAGGSASTTVTITSVGGFNQTVTLACGSITLNGAAATTAPPTCKFSPSSISNASGTSTLTISTTGPSAALAPVSRRSRSLFYVVLLPILGMTLIGTGLSSRRKKLLGISLAGLMISGVLFLAACGGGNRGGGGGGAVGTPPGTYTITISGTAGSVENNTKVTLTVQ
jgi:hypothetical protein